MSELKISCLSIDCPERDGGICRFDPRTPRNQRPRSLNAFEQAWQEVEGIIKEFGNTDPAECIAILEDHVTKALAKLPPYEGSIER